MAAAYMRLPFPLRWEALKAERLTRKHQHNRIENPTVRDNYYQSLALWWVQVCCVYLAAHCSGWMEVRERLCLCPWDVFWNTFHAWRALICAFNTMCTLSSYLCFVQKKTTLSQRVQSLARCESCRFLLWWWQVMGREIIVDFFG